MKKRNQVILLIGLVILLFAINYNFLDEQLENLLDESQSAQVGRIIDGDTIETFEDETIRLLGINTPERGEKYYEEAKEFLNNSIFNKTIKLEFTADRIDKYGRTLAYVFLENTNINVQMVEMGFANYYFYSGRDKYSDDLEKAWSRCINNNKNLCEVSMDVCAKCVNVETNYIVNTCTFSCDINGWIIKGEGREKFIFNGTLNKNDMAGFELDLANSGGSLFLRDDEGRLAVWKKD